jgi:hypothetical protein
MTKPAKGNARRKRRLPRYWASVTTLGHEFAPTESQWRQMEEALECLLGDKDRAEIRRLSLEYFEAAETEQNAPFVTDVRKCLDSIIDAAGRLGSLLVNPPGNATQREAAFQAQAAAFSQMRITTDGKHTREDLIETLETFVNTAIETDKDLKERAASGWGYIEGDSWKTLIIHLWKYAEKREWKPSASKGRGKSHHGPPSRFVAFVAAVQCAFPTGLRRYSHSLDGLAKAVSAARSSAKNKEERNWEWPDWLTDPELRK